MRHVIQYWHMFCNADTCNGFLTRLLLQLHMFCHTDTCYGIWYWHMLCHIDTWTVTSLLMACQTETCSAIILTAGIPSYPLDFRTGLIQYCTHVLTFYTVGMLRHAYTIHMSWHADTTQAYYIVYTMLAYWHMSDIQCTYTLCWPSDTCLDIHIQLCWHSHTCADILILCWHSDTCPDILTLHYAGISHMCWDTDTCYA